MRGFFNLRNLVLIVSLLTSIAILSLLDNRALYAQNTTPFYPIEYRPYKGNWLQLNTPHFRIIYPEGLDSIAYNSGRILEQQYPLAQSLTGGSLWASAWVCRWR